MAFVAMEKLEFELEVNAMTYKEVTQLPLWEHAAESGRFAEYLGVGSGLYPWNLVGKGLISCLTLIGGVADVLHVGAWSSSVDSDRQAVAAEVDTHRAGLSPIEQPDGRPLEIVSSSL